MDQNLLLSPNITDELISEVLYSGKWDDISIIKDNPRFQGYDSEVWPLLAKDLEFNWAPWTPVLGLFLIMIINMYFRMFQQFYSAIMAFICLGYVSYVIPLITNLTEKNRIKAVDDLLLDTPFHRSLHPLVNAAVEKEIQAPFDFNEKKEAPKDEAPKD